MKGATFSVSLPIKG